MADFRKLALDLIAADGKVDEAEIKILKRSLYADGKIRHDEFVFLAELRAAVNRKAKETPTPEFDKFFLKAVQDSVLDNGIVSEAEVGLLKKHVLADKRLPVESVRTLLHLLKKKAVSLDKSFAPMLEAFEKKNPAPAV